jgi:hypothetical protein
MKKTILIWLGMVLMAEQIYGLSLLTQLDPCDSLLLSNGRTMAVKNLKLGEEEVSFSYCNDPSDRVFTAPWRQVVRIKKSDGSVIESREVSPAQSREASSQKIAEKTDLDKKVDALVQLSWLSLGLVVLGIGFLLAIIAFFWG